MASSRQSQRTRTTRAQRRAEARSLPRTRAPRPSNRSKAPLIGGIVTVLAVVAILAVGVWRNSSATSSTGLTVASSLNPAPNQLAVGTKAPNFTLKAANGRTYSLAAQRGHPVLLEFFAVWCPNCQAEAPTLARIADTYVPKGVRVWSILANPYGKDYERSGRTDLRLADKGDLTWFAKQFNVSHPQLIDPHFGTVNRYGIQGYPGIYIIGPSGKIVYSKAGPRPYSELAQHLDAALKAEH